MSSYACDRFWRSATPDGGTTWAGACTPPAAGTTRSPPTSASGRVTPASELAGAALDLQGALLERCRAYPDAPFPGYTHLQPAQPVLFAHHLLAYSEMLERDLDRLSRARRAADVMPLGSAALAGTTFAIRRDLSARHLGFAASPATAWTPSPTATSRWSWPAPAPC